MSTTVTLAILVAAQLGQIVPRASASLIKVSTTVTLLVGAILVLDSFLRQGFIANFISEPVFIGFEAGIALVMVLDQVLKLLGIHFHKGAFVHKVISIF